MYTIATFRNDKEANEAKQLLITNGIVCHLVIRRLKRDYFVRLQVDEETVRKATDILRVHPELGHKLPPKPKPARAIPMSSHYLNMFLIGAGFAWLIFLIINIDKNKFTTAFIFLALLVIGSLISSLRSFYLAGVSGLLVVFGLRGLLLRPPPVEYYGFVVSLIVSSAIVCGLAFHFGSIEDINFPEANDGVAGIIGFSGLLLGGLFGRLITYVVN